MRIVYHATIAPPMKRIFENILDLIFPPSREELVLRTMLPEEVFSKFTPAPLPPFPFITSIFSYRDPLVTELVKEVKNRKNKRALELAGYALYQKLLELNIKNALLIPLPLSKKRLRERGYNQCELLIEEILKHDKHGRFQKDFTLLTRKRDRGEQKLKKREERLTSAENIFDARAVDIDLSVVLVDDVTTTGSTLDSARQALLHAGYTDVSAITLAH
jgi:competence protein ComFC